MKVAEICQKWLQQYLFHCDDKASNMAMCVSRFVNIHKLRCHMIHNYCYYTISVFCKCVYSFSKQKINYAVTVCIPELW